MLVIGADKMSSIIDYTDRTTCILFGDGAGAVLLQPSTDRTGSIDSIHHSGGDAIVIGAKGGVVDFLQAQDTVAQHIHYIKQDGKAVLENDGRNGCISRNNGTK